MRALVAVAGMLIAGMGLAQEPAAEKNPTAQNPQRVTEEKDGRAHPVLGLNTPPNVAIIEKGTEVDLVFAQSVSSKHAVVGEKVELRVANDVYFLSHVVIPKGARVLGTVVQGKKNEKRGNAKDLAVSVDYILVGDKKVKLTGVQEQKKKTNAGAATASAIAFGLSGLLIYMESREAWIREGTPVTGYVAEQVMWTIDKKDEDATPKSE